MPRNIRIMRLVITQGIIKMNEPKVMTDGAKKRILAATKIALDRNGGKSGGWAGKQQVDAILAIVAEEVGATVADYDKDEGREFREAITFFSNASATAQYMEKNGVIEKRTSRVAKRENIFAGFQS